MADIWTQQQVHV